MKNYFIKTTLNIVSKKYNYDEIKKNEIKYGLESLYLVGSKMIIITILAYILGIFTNYLLFLLFYIPIRSFSFGWHANKSYQCWIFSIISLLLIPYLANIFIFSIIEKIIIISIVLILFLLYAPADTRKKPIINYKKRKLLKTLSIITVLIYISIIFTFNISNIVVNLIIFSLIYQAIMICPFIYILSKQPFNNYKNYIKN